LMGAMMKLVPDAYVPHDCTGKTCCSLDDAEDARQTTMMLGIPFHVCNFTAGFCDEVIDRFINAYLSGRTPNPCIDCNRYMKFRRFLQRATELDCDFIATGHYSRTEKTASGRYLLKTGADVSKDQSYVLYSMTQAELARILFPLGEMTKNQVREIAEANGFVNAKKRDSQDICFAPDGDYAGFIERYSKNPQKNLQEQIGFKPGDFTDDTGKILGKHRGIIHYTIGQRKGLGVYAADPLFVKKINPVNNTIVLGKSNELFSDTLFASDINLIAVDKIENELHVTAKIRYSHKTSPATVIQTAEDELKVTFDIPQRAVTPGQAVVLYDGDIVIGGGTIR